MNKRLAIFTGGDIRTYGGGEKYVIELVKRLKNFDITVISHTQDIDLRLTSLEVKKMLNARLLFYKAFTLPILNERSPFTKSGLKILSDINKFDSIYIIDISLPLVIAILIMLKLKRARTKIILGLHGPGFLQYPIINSILKKFLLKSYMSLYKYIVFKVPNIHALNLDSAKMLKSRGYKGHVYNIPNFLYSEKIYKMETKSSKKFVVLFVGRLSIYHKGLDLLKEVIIKTLSKNNKIIFHIIGSGEEGKELISKIQNQFYKNVFYKGFLWKADLEKEYINSSIFILTSRSEAFPLVILEAQAHGLPVISFNISGPNEIIEGLSGKLIKRFNTREFSDAILEYYELWRNNKLDYKLKNKIINKTFDKYSDKIIIPQLVEMLSEG